MAAMDGERFVSHLQSLGVPGAERLVGSNFDWLFLTDEGSPLAAFLEWFSANVLPSDILTDEDLLEFEELKSRGEVLTGHQLEEMEACLSGLPTSFNSACEPDGQQDMLSQEERERLESQLEVLSMRKDQLSAHKMELREDAFRASKSVKAAEASLKSRQESILSTSRQLTHAHSELASTLNKLTDIFITFNKTTEDEAKFMSQLDFEKWCDEEAKFTNKLKTYIKRQFREGIGEIAGIGDTSEYCLLDVDHLDLHLVRGSGKAEYAQNVEELNRLNKLLRQTEEWRLEGLLLQARRRAEVEEANHLLAAIHRTQLPSSVPLLQQQGRDASESRMVLKLKREQQQQVLLSLISEVAQLESTRTICGNYQLKCQRQEYFLQKQKIVMDQLLAQVARHDWFNVALDLEHQKIKDILEVAGSINAIVSERDSRYQERMKRFEFLSKHHDETKALGQLPPALITLSQLLPLPTVPYSQEDQKEAPVSGKTLEKQVEMLLRALNSAREQMATARNPQFSVLNRMSMNCALLETGLFGSAGSLGALPLAWLDPAVVERYSNLDEKVWKFKQKLLKLICEHEEKKKILQIEPTVREDFMKWTKNLLKGSR
ncbi:HAUS augmin-like complex subunit 3 isoform X1 [Penaeus vannamei]|uniref:HAUS augmin-like complex subunit 3 N-terminal domain-containing protein n=2 Tax=Penaeus vannamei TaxID=6689 RepID=A0A423T129_PENVA|nr:AUGMIN subunit 3-like isoform X1 [Penaeus vannamei]ROT70229.1 hypothetical protein C7M84_011511 [Penaeus vannamei]